MSATFNAFDYLAYIIPGSVFVYALMWLSPTLKAPLVEDKIDLGSFGVFVIIAFVAGQLLHAAARYVPEWPMAAAGWVYRTSELVCSHEKMFGTEIRAGVAKKLSVETAEMNAICDAGDLQPRRNLLRQIFARESKAPGHDRVELFERLYYLNLDLAAAFILLIPVTLILRPQRKLISVFFLAGVILTLERASHLDRIYARELIQSFLSAPS
jgi:hypothetical protein